MLPLSILRFGITATSLSLFVFYFFYLPYSRYNFSPFSTLHISRWFFFVRCPMFLLLSEALPSGAFTKLTSPACGASAPAIIWFRTSPWVPVFNAHGTRDVNSLVKYNASYCVYYALRSRDYSAA